MTRREDCGNPAEDPERARIRKMLLEGGVLSIHITERLMDFWIAQDAKDREEGRRLGYERPSRLFFGAGG